MIRVLWLLALLAIGCGVAEGPIAPSDSGTPTDGQGPTIPRRGYPGEWVHEVPGGTELGSAVVNVRPDGFAELWPGCTVRLDHEDATSALIVAGSVCQDMHTDHFTVLGGALRLTDGVFSATIEGDTDVAGQRYMAIFREVSP